MTYATYHIGSPVRPPIKHDNGFLDSFAKRSATASDRLAYAGWRTKLEVAEAGQGFPGAPEWPDALPAYRHFLDNTGTDRNFSYERYVANDASGKTTLKNLTTEAMSAAYDLHTRLYKGRDARFAFTGTGIPCGRRGDAIFPYPQTENWQKAIGAHSVWISGSVDAQFDEAGKAATVYELTFVIHAEDKYNFNPGASDIATGTPDSANGRFEVSGLAKQYMNFGTLTRHIKWSGAPGATFEVSKVPFLRTRQPSDNRRLRNRA